MAKSGSELNAEEGLSYYGEVMSNSYQYTPNLTVKMNESENVVGMFSLQIDDVLLIDVNQLVVHQVISESHYSIVYSGMYKSRPVAIKTTMPDNAASVSPDRRDNFEREVVMLSNLKHENIVKLVGIAVEPTMLILTELMEGGTLQKYLWSLRPKRLDIKLAIKFALDIACAMEYLHSLGIIHRDLKPANLLLTSDMTTIKVADFGLSREDTDGDKTIEAGTYRWMAPELFNVEAIKRGERKFYDRKVDVYSFSMVLWEMLTNDTPFKGKSTMIVAYAAANKMRPPVDNLPPGIVPLVESCWSHDPRHRPEFTAIREYLENFQQSLYSEEEEEPIIPKSMEDGKDFVKIEDSPEMIEAKPATKNRGNWLFKKKGNWLFKKTGNWLFRCFSCSYK